MPIVHTTAYTSKHHRRGLSTRESSATFNLGDMRAFARLLKHTPLIKFVGGPHKAENISHAVKAHPCAPDGKVPGSSGLGAGTSSGSQFKSGIEPREGEVFSRAELSPRFRYKPIKDSEIEQLLSGGAELVF